VPAPTIEHRPEERSQGLKDFAEERTGLVNTIGRPLRALKALVASFRLRGREERENRPSKRPRPVYEKLKPSSSYKPLYRPPKEMLQPAKYYRKPSYLDVSALVEAEDNYGSPEAPVAPSYEDRPTLQSDSEGPASAITPLLDHHAKAQQDVDMALPSFVDAPDVDEENIVKEDFRTSFGSFRMFSFPSNFSDFSTFKHPNFPDFYHKGSWESWADETNYKTLKESAGPLYRFPTQAPLSTISTQVPLYRTSAQEPFYTQSTVEPLLMTKTKALFQKPLITSHKIKLRPPEPYQNKQLQPRKIQQA